MKPERHATYQLTLSQFMERILTVLRLIGEALEEGKRLEISL